MHQLHDLSNKEACNRLRYEVKLADLPVSCPPRNLRVWDAHPRVYLPVEATGEYICPYCSALFVVTDFVPKEDE